MPHSRRRRTLRRNSEESPETKEEFEDAIMNTEFTPRDLKNAEQLCDQARFISTAVLAVAINCGNLDYDSCFQYLLNVTVPALAKLEAKFLAEGE